MGFTKLDDGLIFSSILSEDDAVFKVWVLILSRTDGDGVARISASFIASVTRKADAEVEQCLQVLEAPDPRSRSTNDEGRRIERVDGGFKVLNYHKYRERADAQDIRTYERERKARQRETKASKAPVPEVSRTDAGPSASASLPSVIRSSVQEGGVGGGPRANPLVAGRRVELEKECQALARGIADLTGEDPIEVLAGGSHYQGARRTAINPASMTDDRLANTVRDLRRDLAELNRRRDSGAPIRP
jgi:hypothetical protein